MSAAMAMVKGSVLSLPMTFVSGNAKKLKEVRAILDRLIPFQLLKLDLSELQGEPEDISKSKAKIATKEINGLGLVQHTCLRDECTGGLLGPHIKRFLQKIGDEGLNNLLMPYEDKSAHALCIFSLALGPNIQPITFVEKTAGKFGPTRGPNDFGWDPLDVSLLGEDLFVHWM